MKYGCRVPEKRSYRHLAPDTRHLFNKFLYCLELFVLGVALGRYAEYLKPLRTGLAMALLGVVLIAAVKALGG